MVYRNARNQVHQGIRKVNNFGKQNLSQSAQKAIVNKANQITRKVPKSVRSIVGNEIKTALANERRKPAPSLTKPRMTTMPVNFV